MGVFTVPGPWFICYISDMKKPILLTLMSLILLSAYSHNQPCPCKSSYIITVDVQKKTVTFPCKDHFKRGDYVQIKVIDYNPYLYKVSINNSDTSTVAPTEGALFSWFLNPADLTSIASSITNVAGVVGSAGVVPGPTTFDQVSDRAALAAVRSIPAAKIAELPAAAQHGSPKDILTAKAVKDFSDYQQKCQQEANKIWALNSQIQADIYTLAASTDFLYQLDPPANSFQFANLESLRTNLESTYSKYRQQVEPDIQTLSTEYAQFTADASLYYSLFPANSQLRAGDSLINQFYSKGLALLAKMDSTLSYQEVQKRKAVILQLESISQEYLTLPQYFLNDIKNIAIQISPWSDSAKISSFNTNIQLPQLHHFVFGVNAGFYLSWLGDDSYGLDTTMTVTPSGPTDTAYKFVKTNNGRAEVGINALAYGAWRLMDRFYAGPVMGAGLSISSDSKPRLFLGGTLLYGETNKVMISGGFVTGYTKRLSPLFPPTTIQQHMPQNYMIDQMKGGWFLSINYSFLGN
jgi:hypothetical protein